MSSIVITNLTISIHTCTGGEPPTNKRDFFDHILGDGLPARGISTALHHTPEKQPVEMTHMIHQKKRALLELLLIAKCTAMNPKNHLWGKTLGNSSNTYVAIKLCITAQIHHIHMGKNMGRYKNAFPLAWEDNKLTNTQLDIMWHKVACEMKSCGTKSCGTRCDVARGGMTCMGKQINTVNHW